MIVWWRSNRRRQRALEAEAEGWLARHGRFARRLAGARSVDAYLLGDLDEQERWGRIREIIEEREAEARRSPVAPVRSAEK
jgi:hypothetical protein